MTNQKDFVAATSSSMETVDHRSSELVVALDIIKSQGLLAQKNQNIAIKALADDLSTKISSIVPMMSAEQSQLMQDLFHRIEDLIKTGVSTKNHQNTECKDLSVTAESELLAREDVARMSSIDEELQGRIEQLCLLAKDKEGISASAEAQDIIEDLTGIVNLFTSQKHSSWMKGLERKRKHEECKDQDESTDKRKRQARTLEKLRGLLTSSETMDLNRAGKKSNED